jgi:hypothetical protein
MTERPILFSGPMVRALLDGTKTQTRRVMKPQPVRIGDSTILEWRDGLFQPERLPNNSNLLNHCPYGQPGDRLWVRETWRHTASSLDEARAITEDIASGIAVDWRATYIERCIRDLGFSREDAEMADDFERWRPSIHMPRWASRILLEITGVRVERLQEISRADAVAEGIDRVENNYGNGPAYCDYGMKNQDDTAEWFNSPIASYHTLWESINGAGSWAANPWVWVVEFRRIGR